MARTKRDPHQIEDGYQWNTRALANGYKTYQAFLTQSGSNDPVATERINDLSGSVVWTRSASGSFLGTLSGAFPATLTSFIAAQSSSLSHTFGTAVSSSGNTVILAHYSASTAVDGFANYPIDIKVFV